MAPDPTDHAFRIGDRSFTWHDLRTAPGLATFWAAEQTEAAPRRVTDHIDVHEAGVAFRRERRLLAADDLRAWLGAFGLTVDEWRTTLAELVADVDPQAPPRTGDELENAMWAHAIISGSLDAALHDFAADAAARARYDDAPDALEQFLTEVCTASAVQAELERQRLDWTVVDLSTLTLPHADAAREAIVCITHDGASLTDVGALADRPVGREIMTVGDLAPAHRGAVRAAQLGQPVGPLAAPDGDAVVVVHERRVPTDADPAALAAATDLVKERAVDQLVDDLVTWSPELV